MLKEADPLSENICRWFSKVLHGDLEFVHEQPFNLPSNAGWLHSQHHLIDQIIAIRNQNPALNGSFNPDLTDRLDRFRRFVIAGAVTINHSSQKTVTDLPNHFDSEAKDLLSCFIRGLHDDLEYSLAASGQGQRLSISALSRKLTHLPHLKSTKDLLNREQLISLILNADSIWTEDWTDLIHRAKKIINFTLLPKTPHLILDGFNLNIYD